MRNSDKDRSKDRVGMTSILGSTDYLFDDGKSRGPALPMQSGSHLQSSADLSKNSLFPSYNLHLSQERGPIYNLFSFYTNNRVGLVITGL